MGGLDTEQGLGEDVGWCVDELLHGDGSFDWLVGYGLVTRGWRDRLAGTGQLDGVDTLDQRGVGERGDDAGQELGSEVDGQLLPLDRAARDLLDEHRADGARRVDGRTGGRGDRDDGGEDHEADRQPGESRGGLVVDDSEDREHEDECPDELGRERLRHTHGIGVRGDPEADVTGLLPEHGDDRAGADDGPDELGTEIRRHIPPRKLPGDGEADGDRGIDVVATDVPERIDGGDDDRSERQRDHPEIGHREGRVAVDDERGGDRADADEDQEGGPDDLGGELLGGGWFVHGTLLSLSHGRPASPTRCRVVLEHHSIMSNDVRTLR